MQVIGFNFTKIIAERLPDFKLDNINNNIQFTDLKKEKIELLKDSPTFKIDFKYSLIYEDKSSKDSKQGEVSFDGNFLIAADKEEAKKLEKSWKNKQLPLDINEFLVNFLLRKCASKALSLEEDVQLPLHIRIPPVKLQKQEDK